MKKSLFTTGFSAAALIVSGALSFLCCKPPVVQSESVEDRANVEGHIVYRFIRNSDIIDYIIADVDGEQYKISMDKYPFELQKVVCIMDFDGDGYVDMLLATESDLTVGLYFRFLSYDGKGHFNFSDSFGYCCDYSIHTYLEDDNQHLREQITVDVTDVDYLDDGQEDILYQSFKLIDGKAVKVSEQRRERIGGTITQVVPVDIKDPEEPYIWAFDLNKDGKPESIISELVCSCAGGVSTAIVLQGDTLSLPEGDRFGILPTMTNGYHDLVIDASSVMYWNGKEYVGKE